MTQPRFFRWQPFERLEQKLPLTQTPLSLFEINFDTTESRFEDSLSSVYRLGDEFAVLVAPYGNRFSVLTNGPENGPATYIGASQLGFGGTPNDVVQLGEQLYLFQDTNVLVPERDGLGGQRILRFSPNQQLEEIKLISPIATIDNLSAALNAPPTNPFQFTYAEDLYFMAQAEHGRGEDGRRLVPVLWRTDGTTEGTNSVSELIPGLIGTHDAVEINDRMLLSLQTESGHSLWTFDGTSSGTQRVLSGQTSMLVISNELAYFAVDSELGRELFASDGTSEGTYLVADLNEGASDSNPTNLTAFQDGLMFTADSGNGEQLWYTNGSEAETNALYDGVVNESVVADQFYFTNGDATELYRANSDDAEQIFDSSAAITLLGATEDMLLFEAEGVTYSVGSRNETTLPVLFESPGEFQLATPEFFIFTTDALELNELFEFEFESIYTLQPWISDGTNASTQTLGTPVVVQNGPPAGNPRLVRTQEVDGHLTVRIYVDHAGGLGLDRILDFAYELDSGPTPGDANLDGIVSFADFLILSSNFGKTDAAFADGDFDGNGVIEFIDFLILSNNFGQ